MSGTSRLGAFDQVERHTMRMFDVKNPNKYNGFLGNSKSNYQRLTSQTFFVNGVVEKCDGNFLRDFKVSTISDTRVSIGSYPQNSEDVSVLRQNGITAVVNLMTRVEKEEREVTNDNMHQLYKQNGIHIS